MIILKKLEKYSITNKKPKKIVFTLEVHLKLYKPI
jgi:hypothetical protein